LKGFLTIRMVSFRSYPQYSIVPTFHYSIWITKAGHQQERISVNVL
jgi:hypothetical protein